MTADLCPQGYDKLYNNGCYKIGTEMLSWYDARSDCQKTANADLININSAEEDAFFRNVGFGADWWIGKENIDYCCYSPIHMLEFGKRGE